MTPRTKTLTLALAVLIAVGGISGCAAPNVDKRVAGPTLSGVSGSTDAVNFDEGYIAFGAGEHVVDLYIDPLCPYCKLFESLDGDFLFREAEQEKITLRVHPVAILSQYSEGTEYSTRAAATLTAVAESNPESAATFITALFDAQPHKNTEGLTDQELEKLAVGSGAQAPDPARLEELQRWVNEQTEKAVTTELSDEAGTLTHVPMTLVNGALFHGNSSDLQLFREFYTSYTAK
ncbi:DsbA family protein [Microbacterium foliorum]